MTKSKEWLKSHKKQIAIVAGIAVGGIALYAITRGKSGTAEIKNAVSTTIEEIPEPVNYKRELPDIGIGTVTDDMTCVGEDLALVVNDIHLSDIGVLGEKAMEYGGFEPDRDITVMFAIYEKNEGETA